MASNRKKLDLEKRDLVQAVIVADAFDNKFGPITDHIPKCLTPVANTPILAYSLEALKCSGVEEVFIYCSNFAQKVKDFLDDSGWNADEDLAVTVITNEDCRSFGDAMRDLDGKGLLRHDFVLLSGDTIFNVDLKPFLLKHKERAIEDKNATMSLIFKKASPSRHIRTLDQEVFLAIDAKTNQVLHHQIANQAKLEVPIEVFEEHSDVELCFDLADPCLSICSHAVPPLFADNFDCQTYDNFINRVITNDLLDNTIYMDTIDDGYAARAGNFMSFLAITHDVVNRWMYPMVPDMSLLKQNLSHPPYKLHRHNIYKCDDVKVLKSSKAQKNVVLGPNCHIGAGSSLINVTIGANCKIGTGVTLKNCVILDKVVIGDGCEVESSIIGSGAKLGKKVKIEANCVLGHGVELCKSIPAKTRLTATKSSDGFSDDEDDDKDDSSLYGAKAFVYNLEEEDSDEEEENLVKDLWGLRLADCPEDSESSDDGSDIEMENPAISGLLDEDATLSVFHSEVFDSLQRGLREKVDTKNLIVEINSSRYAYNANQGNVVHSVITSLLKIASTPASPDESLTGVKLFKEVQRVLKQFHNLLLTYTKSQATQLDCLYGIEEHAKNSQDFVTIAKNTIHFLYEADVLAEESILEWFQDGDDRYPEFGPKLREQVKPFIDWLEEDEEDSDDE